MFWSINDKNAQCGLFNCIVSGGIFEKGVKYPYFINDGRTYIFLFNIDSCLQTFCVSLDCYDNNTYKPIGTWDECENATFVKECEPNVEL